MKRLRFRGTPFSIFWIVWMSATNIWGVFHGPSRYFVVFSYPFIGFLSYLFGRLDQRNIDLQKEIQQLESEIENFQPVAKLTSKIHFK